jgi:circadian clock protein KaiC
MKRIMSSGVRGLDKILGGGFLRPSTILIAGGVGAGKTTLALQSLFHAARRKERGLFIASVSEPITSINNYLSSYSFFDPDCETMHFMDAGELQRENKDVIAAIRENIEYIKPDRVVIDSFFSLASRDKDAMYALFAYLKGKDILLFLTDVFTKERLNDHYIAALVDGVLFLSRDEGRRWLSVLKLRGQNISIKRHAFKFSAAGIEVFPKLNLEEAAAMSDKRIRLGVRGIEQILNEDVLEGSAILAAGEIGTGKTLFGFHFIHTGAIKGEKGLIISLNEDLATINRNARHFGFDFKTLVDKGLLDVFYAPVIDMVPDEHLKQLKEALKGVNRVFIDGVSCYQSAFSIRSEYIHFLRTFISLCKSRGITTIFTSDTNPGAYYPAGIAHLVDGIILLSSAEEMGVKRRYVEIIKMIGSAHTTGKKLMDITSRGLEVSPS